MLLVIFTAAWTGCTGTDEDEGWVKHTASSAEQEARQRREEQANADIEARREKQEELLRAIEDQREAEMASYSRMLATDPLMLETRLGLSEEQKKPVLDIIHQSMLDKREVYRKYGGNVDLRMKAEIREVDSRTEGELTAFLNELQMKEYKMVIDEMRRGFYLKMQPEVEPEEDVEIVSPPSREFYWESIPRVWRPFRRR
jgi:hypothetical protein